MLDSPVSHRHTHQAPSGTEERGREGGGRVEGRVREGGGRVEGRAREGGGRVEGRGEKEKEKGRKEAGVTQVQLVRPLQNLV